MKFGDRTPHSFNETGLFPEVSQRLFSMIRSGQKLNLFKIILQLFLGFYFNLQKCMSLKTS